MAGYVDIDLQKNSNNYYDIYFDNTGDFGKTKGFNTALKMSLLVDGRAAASQVPEPQKRRGFWGNFLLGYSNYQLGSLLWLLSQAKATQNTLNSAITFARNALQWLIDDGHLNKVNVTGSFINLSSIELQIDLIRSNSIVESYGYQIWENTIYEKDIY